MYRILTFDGGGIRGLVTLAMLKRLQSQVPNLIRNADVLAGTSTGGIIALGLAAGKSVDDMIALYQNDGAKIFKGSVLRDIADFFGLAGARYDQGDLKVLLEGIFGEMCLKDLAKRVVIPSFDLDNRATDPAARTWNPKFFHNFAGPDSDGGERVVDVALSTSAAPTYFPTHGTYIDGGVVANNPSMAALAQTQDVRNAEVAPFLHEIRMLSLGTGVNLSYKGGKNHNWGLAQWAEPLVDLLLESSMGVADYQSRCLLKGNYRRISPEFPHDVNIALDAWQQAPHLLSFGEGVDLVDANDHTDVAQWLVDNGW